MATLAGLAKPSSVPLQAGYAAAPTTAQTNWNATQAGKASPLGNLSGQIMQPTTQGAAGWGGMTDGDRFQWLQGQGGMGNLGLRDQIANQNFGGDQNALYNWFNTQSYKNPYQVQQARAQGTANPNLPANAGGGVSNSPNGMTGYQGNVPNINGTTNTGGFVDGGIPKPPTQAGAPVGATGQPGAVPSSATGQPDWSKLDISKFLDPNVDYRIQKGSEAIQNSAAAKGGLYSGATAKGIADYAGNEAQNAYQNAQSAAFNDRNFMRGTYTNDRDYTTNLGEFNANLANQQNQFNQNLGQRQTEFNTGVDQNDRNFAYNAQVGDRNFNYQSLQDLANLGMQGNNGVNSIQQMLARLTSANTIASGTAGAQGTMGGNNALMQMIQSMLGQYGSNNLLSNFGLGGGN
jgi:hypothetical protein